MNEAAICTDSSALLPADVAHRFGVEVVPIAIALDGEPYDEQAEPIDDFYERLSAGAEVTTSQPSPGNFADAYARLSGRGARRALSIHLDARVSGTIASAELAAREAPIPVSVVDTRTASYGVGACVRAAAEVLAAGGSASDAVASATGLGASLKNVFVVRDGPGGRVPGQPGWAVLMLTNGITLPIAAPTRVGEAIDLMAAQILGADGPVRAAVGHAGATAEAAAGNLADELSRLPHVLTVERYRVGASVGAHTGPVSFGAFWWPAEP